MTKVTKYCSQSNMKIREKQGAMNAHQNNAPFRPLWQLKLLVTLDELHFSLYQGGDKNCGNKNNQENSQHADTQ